MPCAPLHRSGFIVIDTTTNVHFAQHAWCLRLRWMAVVAPLIHLSSAGTSIAWRYRLLGMRSLVSLQCWDRAAGITHEHAPPLRSSSESDTMHLLLVSRIGAAALGALTSLTCTQLQT